MMIVTGYVTTICRICEWYNLNSKFYIYFTNTLTYKMLIVTGYVTTFLVFKIRGVISTTQHLKDLKLIHLSEIGVLKQHTKKWK